VENFDLLKRLCETPGVPGREERVRALIEKEIEGLFDSCEVDAMGSLICTRNPRAPKKGKAPKAKGDRPLRVMLLAHMDEIGFYVTAIDRNGFLWMNPAGGFDTRNLFSRRVLVCTDDGDIKGVMNPGGRPVHISSPKDRERVPEVKEFFVDIGLPADKVKKLVKVGDYVVMDEPAIDVGNKFVSKALDNRVACWLGIEAVHKKRSAFAAPRPQAIACFLTSVSVLT